MRLENVTLNKDDTGGGSKTRDTERCQEKR